MKKESPLRNWIAIARCLAAAIVLVAAAGCSDEPFRTVPVSGKVTYEDGTPIPAPRLAIHFEPQLEPVEGKFYPKAATAEVDPETGEFSMMTTHKMGDGAILGEHHVYIVPMTQLGTAAWRGVVPYEFTTPDTSPLRATVTRSGETFEFKVPKPQK